MSAAAVIAALLDPGAGDLAGKEDIRAQERDRSGSVRAGQARHPHATAGSNQRRRHHCAVQRGSHQQRPAELSLAKGRRAAFGQHASFRRDRLDVDDQQCGRARRRGLCGRGFKCEWRGDEQCRQIDPSGTRGIDSSRQRKLWREFRRHEQYGHEHAGRLVRGHGKVRTKADLDRDRV